MSAGFVHEAIDLIALGNIYSHVHKKKDEYAQRVPGLRHRERGHEWYHCYDRYWNFDYPTPLWRLAKIQEIRERNGPDHAEELMSSDGHDLIDRSWDVLSKTERKYWEGFFVWLLLRPHLLELWAGVDVVRGRVCRFVDGKTIWEDSPEIVEKYRALRRKVSKSYKHRLQDLLAQFGG
jgi:hypothetical protein